MKLFFKILLLIFTMIITTVGETKSSTVVNLLQEETSCPIFQKLQLSTGILKNHSGNSCLNEENIVTCSEHSVSLTTKAAKTGMTKVGRWMSEAEYNVMKNTGRMVEGAGDKTSVAVGGPNAFIGAAKGSVYVEFEVPTSSLIQGGQSNWYSIIGPNANKAQLYMPQKQVDRCFPRYKIFPLY